MNARAQNNDETFEWPFDFLNKKDQKRLNNAKFKSESVDDSMDVNDLRDAMKVRILVMLEQLNHALQYSKDEETPLKEQFTQSKYDMVKAYAEFISLEIFLQRINGFFKNDEGKGEIKKTMLKLYRISCLKSLIANCGEVYAANYFHRTSVRHMKLAFE